MSSQRLVYKIDLPDLRSHNLLQENEPVNACIWHLRYPSNTKTLSNICNPLIFGGEARLICIADEHGMLHYYKDRDQLEKNCGSILMGHASSVSRLRLLKDQQAFISLGHQDNALIEWKTELLYDEKDVALIEAGGGGDPKAETEAMNIYDDPLLRELNFSFFLNNISDKFRDSIVLFRGTTQKILNSMLYETIPAFPNEKLLNKRLPPLSVELDFVYGFQSYERRNTLAYVHYHASDLTVLLGDGLLTGKPAKGAQGTMMMESPLAAKTGSPIPSFLQKQMVFSKTPLINYDEKHEACERNFLWICSRLAVIFNPNTNTQRFYQGHKYKISCIAVHPSSNNTPRYSFVLTFRGRNDRRDG
jgi:hypothetical protein